MDKGSARSKTRAAWKGRSTRIKPSPLRAVAPAYLIFDNDRSVISSKLSLAIDPFSKAIVGWEIPPA